MLNLERVLEPGPLRDVTDGLICAVQSRTLLHQAGEWVAGAGANVPDEPTKRDVEHVSRQIHDAEQAVQELAAKLRKRLEVLREGRPRITQGPGASDG